MAYARAVSAAAKRRPTGHWVAMPTHRA